MKHATEQISQVKTRQRERLGSEPQRKGAESVMAWKREATYCMGRTIISVILLYLEI